MPAATESRPRTPLSTWVVGCALTAAVACAYANSIQGPFVFDDLWTIRDQLYIRAPYHVPALFALSPPRFLTMLSFALTYWGFGLTVWPYHVGNVVLYTVNGLLVYRLLTRWMPRPAAVDLRTTQLGALLAVLGFLLTPVHTQVAAYVTGRAALLGTFWLLLTLLAYARADRSAHPRRWWGLALACYVLGNFSKEIAAVAPALIIVWELWGRGEAPLRDRLRRATRTWPYFLVLLAVLLYRRAALGQQALPVIPRSVSINLLTQSFVTWRYALMEFLPLGLTIDHDVTEASGWGDGRVWLGLGGWSVAVLLAWAARRRAPYITLGLAWFGIALLPDSSVIPMQDIMADHRTYLAGIGLWTIVGAGWAVWVSRARARGVGHRRVLVALSACVLALFTIGTLQRNRVWRDPLRLWREAVRESPGRARPLANFAAYHLEQEQYGRAIELANKALALDGTIPGAYLNRGVAYLELGDLDRAETDIASFLALHAHAPRTWLSAQAKLAKAHYNLGIVYTRKGRYADAVVAYERARKLHPIDRRLLGNLALTYERLGEYRAAEDVYAMLMNLPDNTMRDWQNLKRTHQFLTAEQTLRDAVVATPDDPFTHLRLGIFYDDLGLIGKAEQGYRTAISLDEAEPLGPLLLANLLRRTGRRSEALSAYQDVLRLSPDNAEALWWRGQMLLAQGLPTEAETFLRAARTADARVGQRDWHPPRTLRDGRTVTPS